MKDPAARPGGMWMLVLSRIGLLTQLGLTLVVPPLLLVLGALWLQKRFGWGDWLLLAAILVGVAAGIAGAAGLIRDALAHDRRTVDKNEGEHR